MPKGHRPCPRTQVERVWDAKEKKWVYRTVTCKVCGGSGWTT